MKTESKPVIEYFHRGKVWRDGNLCEAYSLPSSDGQMTRMECIADARAKGAQARFNYGVVAK